MRTENLLLFIFNPSKIYYKGNKNNSPLNDKIHVFRNVRVTIQYTTIGNKKQNLRFRRQFERLSIHMYAMCITMCVIL